MHAFLLGRNSRARHPSRPHCMHYLEGLIENFQLAGDRQFAEDEAIVGGIGRFRGVLWSRISMKKATTDSRVRLTSDGSS